MIARHLVTVCLIYLSLVLQSSIARELSIYNVRPWFPGIVLVACVILHPDVMGIGWAALLGLAIDGVSSERLGVHLAIATVVASLLSAALQETPSHSHLLYAVFVIVATFLWRSINGLTQACLTGQIIDPFRTLIVASGDATYTAALILMLVILARLSRLGLGRREARTTFSLNNQWSMLTRFER